MKLKRIFSTPELRKPLAIAWSISVIVMVGVPIITGSIYGTEEAKNLLETVQRTSLYYGSAIAGTAATILALMLTVLSLTHDSIDDQDKLTYIRLHSIATFCVLGFTGSVILLLAVSFPVVEFEKIPSKWFEYVYYLICGWNGLLAGCMISTILILKDTASKLIGDLSPDFDDEGDEESKSKK